MALKLVALGGSGGSDGLDGPGGLYPVFSENLPHVWCSMTFWGAGICLLSLITKIDVVFWYVSMFPEMSIIS